ncbi:MAG: hypothetical protein QW156_04465 [Candidatus Aenigmatarchaeota archaeon]
MIVDMRNFLIIFLIVLLGLNIILIIKYYLDLKKVEEMVKGCEVGWIRKQLGLIT